MNEPLTVRPYSFENDYAEICEWWRARERHGWTYIPSKRLPASGYVVQCGETKCGVIFVYHCEAGWAWVEWLTTNPKSPARRRKDVCEMLVQSARDHIARAGLHSSLSSLNNENLIRIYEKYGFSRGQGGMTDMIWNANQ